eukprot:Em0019g1003a
MEFQEEAEGEAEETEGTEVRGGPGGVGASVGGPTREGGDQTRVGMTMEEEEEVAALTGDLLHIPIHGAIEVASRTRYSIV